MNYQYPLKPIGAMFDRRCPDHPDVPPHIVAGQGPHLAQLVCSVCDRHLQWVGRSTLIEIEIAADLADTS